MREIIHDYATSNSPNGTKTQNRLPQNTQEPFYVRWFMPRVEAQTVTQESRGIFIPYPLLGALILIGGAVLTFVVAVQVQVSNLNQQVANLNTTILMRDADQRAQIEEIKTKNAQLEVYIHDDREKLASIQTKLGIRRN